MLWCLWKSRRKSSSAENHRLTMAIHVLDMFISAIPLRDEILAFGLR
jgi:hypothetical protein